MPSYKAVSGKLLDLVVSDLTETMAAHYHGRKVTLCMDGWTSPGGMPTIGFSIGNDLWTVLETGSTSHTGDHVAAMTLKVMEEITQTLQCEIVGVCSDGASNMVLARNKVLQRHPLLFEWHCQAHTMQLLVGDWDRVRTARVCANQIVRGLLVVRQCFSVSFVHFRSTMDRMRGSDPGNVDDDRATAVLVCVFLLQTLQSSTSCPSSLLLLVGKGQELRSPSRHACTFASFLVQNLLCLGCNPELHPMPTPEIIAFRLGDCQCPVQNWSVCAVCANLLQCMQIRRLVQSGSQYAWKGIGTTCSSWSCSNLFSSVSDLSWTKACLSFEMGHFWCRLLPPEPILPSQVTCWDFHDNSCCHPANATHH
jgi:hypothetical protein